MTTCKACGKPCRTTRRALVLFPGDAVPGLVCPKCARDGLLIVARTVPPVIRKAVIRSEGVARTLRMLRTYLAAARSAAASASLGDNGSAAILSGRAEGIETAIETLSRECSE